jgi:hypothetical protein
MDSKTKKKKALSQIKRLTSKNISRISTISQSNTNKNKNKNKNSTIMNKKAKGQFYTTNSDYILEGIQIPEDVENIVEPFAGEGDLLTWLENQSTFVGEVESYDIEPKRQGIIKRDTLLNPPNYENKFVLTNPPYLARNKTMNKVLFDMYETNDLYKCFIKSIVAGNCKGGIIIIPAGFFFSRRKLDCECRNQLLTNYKISQVKYFEETVFNDTPTTVVVIVFEKMSEKMNEQHVPWTMLPSNQEIVFKMTQENEWIIGGEIYNLPVSKDIKISRHVEGIPLKALEQQTYMTLNALDSGKKVGRISLDYKPNFIYPAKECSRTYATIRVSGKHLSEANQRLICQNFNTFLEEKREEYWSLFLPQFRESKEYARKRIPFELAYKIIGYIIIKLRI